MIQNYNDGEVNLGGLKFMGIPVGLPAFVRSELVQFDKTVAEDTVELLRSYPYLQMLVQVYTQCFLALVHYRIFFNPRTNGIQSHVSRWQHPRFDMFWTRRVPTISDNGDKNHTT